jgi:hypothetical protein
MKQRLKSEIMVPKIKNIVPETKNASPKFILFNFIRKKFFCQIKAFLLKFKLEKDLGNNKKEVQKEKKNRFFFGNFVASFNREKEKKSSKN